MSPAAHRISLRLVAHPVAIVFQPCLRRPFRPHRFRECAGTLAGVLGKAHACVLSRVSVCACMCLSAHHSAMREDDCKCQYLSGLLPISLSVCLSVCPADWLAG
eukprot:2690824-Pleurochrysis_carterae.AAC.1